MSQETINLITQWLSLFALIGAIFGSVIIVGTAVYQSIKARTVRWDVLLFIAVLLWSMPYGIRNYGPELMDASIDLINSMSTRRAPLENALKNLIGDTGNPGNSQPVNEYSTPSGGFPTAVPVTPTPNMFEATATAYFGEQPVPVYTATWSISDFQAEATRAALNNPTPFPTVFICRSTQDVMAGCQPPTPVK